MFLRYSVCGIESMNTPKSNKKLRDFLHGMLLVSSLAIFVGILVALVQFPMDALGRAPVKSVPYYLGFFCGFPGPFVILFLLCWFWLRRIVGEMDEVEGVNKGKEGKA